MPEKTLNIGIVGAGQNTKLKHIPALQAIPNVKITTVCNRSVQSASLVAKQFNIPNITQHWTEIIDAHDIDAVLIGTWPNMHCPITLAALDAEKHVLCEARMALNAQQAQKMLDASLKKPYLVAQIVPSPMTLRIDDTIKKLINDGFLGQLLAIEINAGSNFIDKDAPMNWRLDPNLSGLNTMTLGIWFEAVMRWAGPATRLTAMAKTFVKTRKDNQGQTQALPLPDHLNVIADLACDAQLHMRISSVTGLANEDEVWIFGSEGTIKFSQNTLFAARNDNNDQLIEVPIPENLEGKWQVEQDFINSIRTGQPVTLTNFTEGLHYMQFTQAVHQAIATGQTISLPLLTI